MIEPTHQTDAAPPERGCKGIIFLAGAIKYWWLTKCYECGHIAGEQSIVCPKCSIQRTSVLWGGPEHKEYVNYRDFIRRLLIQNGYLTYAPHEAFKGTWDERAQAVNDTGIAISDLMIDLSPPAIPTVGTDSELVYAERVGTPALWRPPVKMTIPDQEEFLATIEELINGKQN